MYIEKNVKFFFNPNKSGIGGKPQIFLFEFYMAIKIFIVKGKLTGLNAHGEGGKILRVIRGKIRG